MAFTATRTRADLREAIARSLGLLGDGETLQGDLYTIVDNRIDDVYMELNRDGLLNFDFTDDSSIPTESFRSIVDIAAYSLIAEVEVPDNLAQRLSIQNDRAFSRLRRMIFEGIISEHQTPDYY